MVHYIYTMVWCTVKLDTDLGIVNSESIRKVN
jgi:hypothetical protein